MSKNKRQLVPSYIRNLKVYQAGKPVEELDRERGLTKISKVANNENPLGPSPFAIKEMTEGLWNLNSYPDMHAHKLKTALSDLYNLKNSKQVSIPFYDYKTHTRKNELLKIDPKPVIIIEGIFSLYNKDIRQLIDIKIFVDTPPDIRVLRRVKRDINKRGRSIESIFEQYTKTVKPMHDKYIQPTMEYADIVILNGGKNKMALNIINSELLPIIKRRTSNVDA